MQPLRHKDLVEISDFEIPRFGSVFCFLAQSFTPSLIHTSSPYPNGTFCTPKTTKTKAVCQTKQPKFGPKAKFRQFLVVFLISFDGFFSLRMRSLPEATLVQHRAEATTTSTGRPGTATSRRCGTSSVSIRSACTRKTSCLAAASKNG